MASLLLFGAGKSASYLIRYFLEKAEANNYSLHVCDPVASQLKKYHESAHLFCHDLSIENEAACTELVKQADIVISLLPAFLHEKAALLCLEYGKNLVTASYVDDKMRALDAAVKEKGLCFLNEAGLDPGIDHMSAMQLIHGLKNEGAEIFSFESFTGGLIAPEHDTNPWHYKFSWNPRNVVLAGAGSSARYRDKHELRFVSYPQLFQRRRPFSHDKYGDFEGYPNRDSLSYQSQYELDGIRTLLRGTLRRPGFCSSWNVFVQIGLTDDSYVLDLGERCNGRTFLNCFLPFRNNKTVEEKLFMVPGLIADEEDLARIKFLGLFSETYMLPITKGTPAQILQAILEEKWKLEPGDRDLIVMIHRIGYLKDGKEAWIESSLAVEGDDSRYTAMAKTVGLPVALCAEEILHGNYHAPGVQIPTQPELYTPVLTKLSALGVHFEEKHRQA